VLEKFRYKNRASGSELHERGEKKVTAGIKNYMCGKSACRKGRIRGRIDNAGVAGTSRIFKCQAVEQQGILGQDRILQTAVF